MLTSRLIDLCVKEARKSEYSQKVSAIIFKRQSNILSLGHNYSSRSLRKLHPRFQKWKGSVHAEVDAIFKAKTDLKGADILVVRINKLGNFCMAKPCQHCQLYLKHVGIRKVYFSVPTSPFIEKFIDWSTVNE